MIITNQTIPRMTMTINNPIQDSVKYQFCFLNRPFVSDTNEKDIYYKLLIWPKSEKIISNFSFLIKINDKGILRPLEFLEFPKLGDNIFDPFGDKHLTIKIPQKFYKSKLQFAFSFKAFEYENYGQLTVNLNWFDYQKIDNILIFYDQKINQSINLLNWNLDNVIPIITFNNTYPNIFRLNTKFFDLTNEITDYESVRKLRFLAMLESQKPELKKITIGNFSGKNYYNFEPKIKWIIEAKENEKTYQLQLTNRLQLLGGQIQEVNYGDIGFKANPFITNTQGIRINFSFLDYEYNLPIPIKQASLHLSDIWKGGYYEI